MISTFPYASPLFNVSEEGKSIVILNKLVTETSNPSRQILLCNVSL